MEREKEEVLMPANLPPQYFETEKKLRTARTPQEKIAILEELLAIVPKHKGTEKLQALLKTKIAKLRAQSQKKPVTARHGFGPQVEKSGAGQFVLVGSPNSGKSSLVRALTNARPEVAAYPFTTRVPTPAMMDYENIQIQLVDMPPVTEDYMEPWQAELIKGADGVLLVLDPAASGPAEDFLRLGARLEEKKIHLVPAEPPEPPGPGVFEKKALIVLNKCDQPGARERLEDLKSVVDADFVLLPVSSETGENLEALKAHMFRLLDIVRVYSKIPGKKVDRKAPFVFKKGSNLMDMARAVHKDFALKLKYARIWGKNKYEGQKVERHYILEDEDIIELHI